MPSVRLEGQLFLAAPVLAADGEQHDVGLALAHALVVPVLADGLHHELHALLGVHTTGLDESVGRLEALLVESVRFPAAGIDGDFGCAAGGAVRTKPVLFPGRDVAIAAVEVALVLGVVLEPELLVGHAEPFSVETLVECLVVRDVSGAPARVDELPFAVVDADYVPRVPGHFG